MSKIEELIVATVLTLYIVSALFAIVVKMFGFQPVSSDPLDDDSRMVNSFS